MRGRGNTNVGKSIVSKK